MTNNKPVGNEQLKQEPPVKQEPPERIWVRFWKNGWTHPSVTSTTVPVETDTEYIRASAPVQGDVIEKETEMPNNEAYCPRCQETHAPYWSCPNNEPHSGDNEDNRPSEHVGWCRYVNHATEFDGTEHITFEACSSDDEGAFKVYRAPATSTQATPDAREALEKIANSNHLDTCSKLLADLECDCHVATARAALTTGEEINE